MIAPMLLGGLVAFAVVGILTFTTWRLLMIDREQTQLYQDFLRLQGESEKAQRQYVQAIGSRLQAIENALVTIDERTVTVTDWARWWAAALAQATRR